MASHRQVSEHYVKTEHPSSVHYLKMEPGLNSHPAHHQPQGHQPSQLNQSRPSSVVHQQHQAQAHPPPAHPPSHQQQPSQHQQQQGQHHPQGAYPSGNSLAQTYTQNGHTSAGREGVPSYYQHQTSYQTPNSSSGYTSADTNSEMMATTQMPRPYPPMSSYHTPQSNSPASVASPSQHDQHRSIYAQPPQHLTHSMYYQPQAHYQSMPPQATASPYAQHAHHPQHAQHAHHPQHAQHAHHAQHPHHAQQPMMVPHPATHNPMSQHPNQHNQPGMTNSPRPKIETQVPVQVQKAQNSPMPTAHQPQNGGQSQSPNPGTGVNPNAAPGPIPATTPPVVRQDGNGVQWIAFEYSRDRVKMEYTIRCDVESVDTESLSPEFKQENCVYPRACCPKDQYRGNRLMYETDCNRVGWALAHLNGPLRGKRGLIQRAVDSWRNSNADPRLRSRRVRRMAKMNTRKGGQGTSHTSPMPGSMPQQGLPSGPGHMAPGGPNHMGKPGMGGMGQPLHHHHPAAHPDGGAQSGGEEVDAHSYNGHTQHHQHPQGHQHQASSAHGAPANGGVEDVRQAHVFADYPNHGYPNNNGQLGSMSHIPNSSRDPTQGRRQHARPGADDEEGLFPNIPEAKKRKFILVDDYIKPPRARIRVVLEDVNTNEIPDSFRKRSSMYPRSYFPREMQSTPSTVSGSHFFPDDIDDGVEETEGRDVSRRGETTMVKVPVGEDTEQEVAIPRMRRSARTKEARLNELGYRMAWLQSRTFSGRTVFLQRAMDTYRNKTRNSIEAAQSDVRLVAPHFETRAGKRRWADRMRAGEKEDEA